MDIKLQFALSVMSDSITRDIHNGSGMAGMIVADVFDIPDENLEGALRVAEEGIGEIAREYVEWQYQVPGCLKPEWHP